MFRGFVHPVVHTLRMTGFEGFERLARRGLP